MKTIFVLIVLSLILSCTVFAEQCLEYEPKISELRGKIVRITYPGPPNYESIKSGDKPEICWVLQLKIQSCTNESENDEMNEKETNIKEVQLVLEKEQYEKYKTLVGNDVIVKGSLFHGFSGHHHTKVLLTVKDIKKIV